jgi:phosphatidylinositol glycan class B
MAADDPSHPVWTVAERKHFRFCLAASAVLFFATAVLSNGFLHPDEYFQIVEFASTKLGITDPKDLPWEYPAQMRPWLQPAIFYGLAKLAAIFGIHRPFTLILLFRILTAVVSWSALWTLVIVGRRWVADETARRRLYSIAAFLWLVPLMGVRTSAETMATAMLCLAIALLEWRTDRQDRSVRFGCAVLAGLAFGLCFEFRYASAPMAAGAALWYLVFTKERVSLFAGLVLGGLAALTLGALADWWGYGIPSFPFYSYLYQNFVLNRAKDFGTAPFFGYFYLPLETWFAPLILFLLVATLAAWLRRGRSVLTWASAPYVVLLSITAHKEARFLYPLVPFLPFFVVSALAMEPPFGARLASVLRWFASGRSLQIGYLINACGFITIALVPLYADFSTYRAIEDESYAREGPLIVAVVHGPGKMPYLSAKLPTPFLKPPNVQLAPDQSINDLENRRARGEKFLTLVQKPTPVPQAAQWVRSHCAYVSASYPWWLAPEILKWERRWWELYRC